MIIWFRFAIVIWLSNNFELDSNFKKQYNHSEAKPYNHK